ncbi:hypothetical protein BD410DRAFT_286520 [Rickenella mellea]|uniref:Uncharacterized protein n=1 Tax=Rickenella mellea TaxID=50990 RepID=A0A4Y7Q2J3_9AGAM|nr:hypothetical protein BD410DRAFT_286520 [Rickenella mellea]
MLAKMKPLIPAKIRRRMFKWYHINELPVELLVEIFLRCLPTCTFPIPSRRDAPLLLGRICRTWRSVTLNTPRLWARITLVYRCWNPSVLDDWPRISRNFHRLGIHEWLRRSGNSPLSFKMEHHQFHLSYSESEHLLALTLQAVAHRWQAVHLQDLDNCICNSFILQIIRSPGRTPMLTDLQLLGVRLTKNGPQDIPCASQLSTFYIYSKFVIPHGNFHALRELRIGLFEPSIRYSSVFAQFPLLQILELTFQPESPTQYETRTATVVHTLQYLHTFIFVDKWCVDANLWLLNMFDTPVLNSLAIRTHNCGHHEGTHLSNFLLRCGGQLQQLMLLVTGYDTSCSGIGGFTQHTPILETLCTGYNTGLLLVDLTTCPTISQIDIIDEHYCDTGQSNTDLPAGVMRAVSAILSQWKVSRLEERSKTVSPFVVKVPRRYLSQILKRQEVKKWIRQGLHVGPLPSPDESWWDRQL